LRRLLASILAPIIVVTIVACSSEEPPQQEEQANEPERTSQTETTQEEQSTSPSPPEPTEQPAEKVAGLGEAVDLDGLSVRLFDVRSENIAHYISGPGSPAESRESLSGEYVAVDYVAENTSGASISVQPQASLEDAQDQTHPQDASIEVRSGGENAELDPGQKLASTMFFEVPSGTTPEQLELETAEAEARIDLTRTQRAEIPPEDYLYVYHAYFNQRAYEEIYAMFDPVTTQGITLGDWLTYFEPIWGDWYASLDGLDLLSSETGEATFFMDRTFYVTDGTTISNPVEQSMLNSGDEWKLVMREDQINDILAAQSPAPEETTSEVTVEVTSEVTTETTSATDTQYEPDPDPDPDPDRRGRRSLPNTPSLPSGDINCSERPSNIPVPPGSDGDADGDGVACEE
jgi:hypothetical protein